MHGRMNRRLDKLFEITVTRYLPMTRALTAEKIVSAYRRMLHGHFEEMSVHLFHRMSSVEHLFVVNYGCGKRCIN